jgi:hypothetical protein
LKPCALLDTLSCASVVADKSDSNSRALSDTFYRVRDEAMSCYEPSVLVDNSVFFGNVPFFLMNNAKMLNERLW